MTTSYTGNPAGVQAPDTVPTVGKVPVLTLPVDGEAYGVSSIYQALKDLADHVAFGAKFSSKAKEVPEWSDLVTQNHMIGLGYYAAFDNASYVPSVLVFTKGAGLLMAYAGLTLTIRAGYLGILNSDDAADPDVAVASQMRWAKISNSALPTVAGASAGQERYSLITAVISASMVATISVTNGTSAAVGAAVRPALPGGQALLAVTRQNDTNIVDVFDYSMPAGPLEVRNYIPKRDGLAYDYGAGLTWTPTTGSDVGAMQKVVTGTQSLAIPILGNPCERLLAFDLVHQLSIGSTIELITMNGFGTIIGALHHLSPVWLQPSFGQDGTYKTARLVVSSDVGSTSFPIWGHGSYRKAQYPIDNTLALLITTATTGDKVHGLRTYSARS